MVIKVLFYNCDCMSPFASLTSIPWMFNSFKEGVLDKNPLTKFFDLLNNYLVLFVISFVILLPVLPVLPVLIAVLDIILLYKTVFKKRYSKRINYMFIFLQVIDCCFKYCFRYHFRYCLSCNFKYHFSCRFRYHLGYRMF